MAGKIIYRTASNLADINSEHPADGFVAWWYDNPGAKFYRFASSHDFYLFLLTKLPKERNYYETARNGAKQKPRFDIDAWAKDLGMLSVETLLADIISAISAALTYLQLPFTPEGIKIYSSSGLSSGEHKYSFHIVLHDFFHTDSGHAKRFYDLVSSAAHQRSRRFIDGKVYNTTQQFRAYGNTKANDNRHKYFIGTAAAFSLETKPTPLSEDWDHFVESLLTVIPNEAQEINIAARPLRETQECDDIDIDSIIDLIPPEYKLDKPTQYGYRLERIARGVEVECIACGRSHASNGAYIRVLKGIVTFCCFADEKRRKIGLGPMDDTDTELDSNPDNKVENTPSSPRENTSPVADDGGSDVANITSPVPSVASRVDKREKIKAKTLKAWDKFRCDDY